MLGWHIPAPDQVLLVSGKNHKDANAPFKIVMGHGAFVMPIRSKAFTLTLAMQESQVTEECVTKQGIAIICNAVIAFKVADDNVSIVNAARRFLYDQNNMSTLTGRIFAGHLRSIVGSMTVEEIIRERQRLAEEVLDASKPEMEKLGLIVDSFQIQSIDDKGSGYITSMAAPNVAAVQRDAQVAQAQANQQAAVAQAQATQQAKIAQANAAQASAEVEQKSKQAQIEYQQATEIAQANANAAVAKAKAEADAISNTAQAQANATVNEANAKAAAAGPLAQATAQQSVAAEQITLATAQAELKEKELLASVTKPAEAEAKRIELLAEANAKQVKLNAEAMAAGSGVTIQRALVDQMPAIIGAAAQQLSNANITVLNGSDGLSELVSGLASQAGSLLRMVRESLAADEVAVPVATTTEALEAAKK